MALAVAMTVPDDSQVPLHNGEAAGVGLEDTLSKPSAAPMVPLGGAPVMQVSEGSSEDASARPVVSLDEVRTGLDDLSVQVFVRLPKQARTMVRNASTQTQT